MGWFVVAWVAAYALIGAKLFGLLGWSWWIVAALSLAVIFLAAGGLLMIALRGPSAYAAHDPSRSDRLGVVSRRLPKAGDRD